MDEIFWDGRKIFHFFRKKFVKMLANIAEALPITGRRFFFADLIATARVCIVQVIDFADIQGGGWRWLTLGL